MLNSIKSKIIVLTFFLLCALGIIVTAAAVTAFYRDKELIITGNASSIAAFESQLNKEIAELEKNAQDLALMAQVYYQNGKHPEIGEFSTKQILQNYPNSMGNGIYFKPYEVSKNKNLSCIHAFREANEQINLLLSCHQGRFDYVKQNWYTDIIEDLQKGKHISWARPYRSTQLGNLMTTVGAGIYDQDKLIGMATVDWELEMILKSILEIKPTPNSFVLFADKVKDYVIATTEKGIDNNTIMGKSLSDLGWYSKNLIQGISFDYKGIKYIPYIRQLNNGLFLIVNVPLFELFNNALHHLYILLAVLLVCTFSIVSILYLVLRRNINEPILKLTEIAKSISQGDLDKTIELDKPSELAQLADAFNKMKTDIKTHLIQLAQVSREKERMESELAIAQTIQESALPKNFPKNNNFELLASMAPARVVGGDFYDFFPIDDSHYAFVMADVSGKGITAALYMMSAKTAIKSMLMSGYSLEDAINKANSALCDNQANGMFVTAFIGILDIKTGQVQYINAGHCRPLCKTQNGYDYVKVVSNLIVGIKSDYKYQSGKLMLESGDRLFLYTDGVTEAQDVKNQMFGNERLQKVLNQEEMSLADTLDCVHQQIKKFVKNASQSDDITMMIIEFHGEK